MKKSEVQEQNIDKAIASLKEKMKLMNFNNLQPPYFTHTLTKLRSNYLSHFLKDINLEKANEDAQIKSGLKTVHYIF